MRVVLHEFDEDAKGWDLQTLAIRHENFGKKNAIHLYGYYFVENWDSEETHVPGKRVIDGSS